MRSNPVLPGARARDDRGSRKSPIPETNHDSGWIYRAVNECTRDRSEWLTWALTRRDSQAGEDSWQGIPAQVRRSQVRSAWRAGLVWRNPPYPGLRMLMVVCRRTATRAIDCDRRWSRSSMISAAGGTRRVETAILARCLENKPCDPCEPRASQFRRTCEAGRGGSRLLAILTTLRKILER